MRILSENTILPGVVGEIEAIIDRPEKNISDKYIAVCCHPHPQHGGAMGNKVIYTASRTLAGLGIPSVRFNFRGVGKSQGEYAEGIGEQDDLKAVVKWITEQFPNRQLLLSGFSFGAKISALQAVNLNGCLLISIAPPIGRIDLNGFIRPDCPWLILQGEDDELVEANQVEQWAKGFEQPPILIKMPEASHFFHGKLVHLRSHIETFTLDALELNR